MKLLQKVFGTNSERAIRKIKPYLDEILRLEDSMSRLSDAEFQQKTVEFKNRLARGESLDDIMVEAFAVCREASWRVLGMKHYPVQILGGIVLHNGNIAEMKTGEGKTLVVTLPAYLNALAGKVHVVTVNDYLAKRDQEWMGKVFNFLGLSVGLVYSNQPISEKKKAYSCDIVYGTNSEFGFDYLRDHMVFRAEDKVQGSLDYAIIDEVDSILIDEARTPLIITSPTLRSPELYIKADQFVRTLTEKDYNFIEKDKVVYLTESGVAKAEKFFGISNLSDLDNININHHINAALRAHFVARRDVDYIVKDNKVIIIDQFTGRLAPGKVYNDGLHQAIEAKEGLEIHPENTVEATITYQNYFRLYKKLAGMTGTAKTEEEEFRYIYNLEVIEIPTNKPMIRIDHPDVIFKTERAKWNAIVNDIKERYEKGQPVLVGTTSVEKSEYLSFLLKRQGIPHQVLNAKYHEQEAYIIAQAGRYKMVTIATNMAGRGTDILLGGNAQYLAEEDFKRKYQISYREVEKFLEEFKDRADDPEIQDVYQKMLEAKNNFKFILDYYKKIVEHEREIVLSLGGLYVIGTERHESRRIDNQLRGRAGRQGDPGESRFYLSLEDDLLRLFGGEQVKTLAESLNLDEDTPISSRFLSGIVEKCQKKLEAINFEIRRNLLRFDDIINIQRNLIYSDRDKVLNADEKMLLDNLHAIIREHLEKIVSSITSGSSYSEEWDVEALENQVYEMFGIRLPVKTWVKSDPNMRPEKLIERIYEQVQKETEKRLALFGDVEKRKQYLRFIFLCAIDTCWKQHIDNIEQLKKGIGLRGYGHQDPYQAFQFEAYKMYNEMLSDIKTSILRSFFSGEDEKRQESLIQEKAS